MELKLIWEIIWRRKWVILQTFLTISLTIIIGSFLLPPVYESKSVLIVEDSSTESSLLAAIGTMAGKATAVPSSEYAIANNVEIAKSKPIIEPIILNLQLTDRKGKLLESEDLLESGLIRKIHPDPSIEVDVVDDTDDTDLIEIVSTSTDPQEAEMIANTLAEECIKNNLRWKKEEYKNANIIITNEIEMVKNRYIMSLEEIKKFSSQQKTLDIQTEKSNAIARISDLMKEKEETVIGLSEIQVKINEFQKQLNLQNEQTVLGTTSSENNYIMQLRNSILEYEVGLEEALIEKRKDHPDVKILEKNLANVRAKLNHEILLSKQYSADLLTHERDLSALKARLQALNKEIDAHMNLFFSIPEKVFNDTQLKLDTEINHDLYKSMLEYLYQIRIAEFSIFPDIKIVEKAIVADLKKPVSPSKMLNSIVGIFLGLMFGLGLGFLLDYLDDTIKSQDDIKKTGETLLGFVPKYKQKRNLLISGKSPKDPVCEAYRSIRNSIIFSSLDKPINSLVVTSPIANEGKTIIACNLAISMTYEGKKVLLFDADYRIPSIHNQFDLQNHIGSTSILTDNANFDEAIQESGIENLSILSTGPIPPDPAQMIESNKMKVLINDLTSRFDIVIIDSSPMLVSNDAVVLAGISDAVISITESHRETYSIFNQARDIFERANIKPLGIILNKLPVSRMNKYNYYYYK